MSNDSNPDGTFGFIGPTALSFYQRVEPAATSIPLHINPDNGFASSHWDESLFGIESMTPSGSRDEINPVSLLTVGLIADLGYEVDFSQADAYTLNGIELKL